MRVIGMEMEMVPKIGMVTQKLTIDRDGDGDGSR